MDRSDLTRPDIDHCFAPLNITEQYFLFFVGGQLAGDREKQRTVKNNAECLVDATIAVLLVDINWGVLQALLTVAQCFNLFQLEW